ncbi:MAG: PLP-dependent aminotransferase family protein [Desulfurococcales archaeon]|nr:PLP-dependent aminotransferase family protein [Desulfurococcales archaeon]
MTQHKLYLSPIEALTNQLEKQPKFNGAAGGPDIIPTELLLKAYKETHFKPGCHDYPGAGGSLEARQAISEYTMKILGFPKTSPDKIIVTAGAQHAIKLLSQLLLDKDEKAVVENPGFIEGRMPIEYQTSRIETIDISLKGEVEIPGLAEKPKLAYTVPTAHNPLGIDYPESARYKLRKLAGEGIIVLEDDPYRALHSNPPDPIWTPGSNIAYIGSLSKTVAPGVRIGFIIPPEGLVEPLKLLSQHDFATNTPIGCMMQYLLDTGDLQGHIALKRTIYVERLDYMKRKLEEEMPDHEMSLAKGGFFVTIRLGCDSFKLLLKALDLGISFVPIRDFYLHDPVVDAIRISIAKLRIHYIDEYVKTLAKIVGECRGTL